MAGVIANLSVWFAVHILFTDVRNSSPPVPLPGSLDGRALMLALLAFVWLLVLKRGLPETLALAALAGAALFLFV